MSASPVQPSPPERRVVVLGASAGGVEALQTVVGGLADDLQATVLVVLHVAASGTSILPTILARRTSLTVRTAVHGEPLAPGLVLVASPDHHLTVGADDQLALTRGPKENGHRPAIDLAMRTAAQHCGPRTAAVVLSGTRDDGTAGAAAVAAAGGAFVVQDPTDALYDGMPASAMAATEPDAILPAAAIAAWINDWVAQPLKPVPAADPRGASLRRTPLQVVEAAPVTTPADASSQATRFTCPDCDGVLFEVVEGGVQRFRCSVGHAYSPDSLDAEQAARMEHALWAAIRALEDRAVLQDRLGARADRAEVPHTSVAFRARAEANRQNAELLRAALGFPGASVGAPPQTADGTGDAA